MKLTVTKRTGTKKVEVKEIRRKGDIPAILYSPGRPCELIVVDGTEFSTLLRQMKPGRLPTTKLTLIVDGKERTAIIKDIQYHLTTYNVTHLDFEELIDTVPVEVKVPIQCIGIVDCIGIKLGGFLRQVIRTVKVKCLPSNMPAEFQVDVRELGIRQSKRLSDLIIPEGVKPLAPMEEVVVVIAKR
ncbi:MAG TPA: 50S ribosomal protein L25/general stress protein Ctc [Rhabdochlamydiaceae bacterium]|nr:50S ribosomal protein L25/general stress protein Ctc [Rhabdochlamydiaceae bacterium]